MGLKGIDMRLSYSEVYIKTIFAKIQLSRDKLFLAGNAHTGLQSWQMYVVRVDVSQSKRIEMGLNGVEMS